MLTTVIVVILKITSTKQKKTSLNVGKTIPITYAFVQDKSIDVKHKQHRLVRGVGVAIVLVQSCVPVNQSIQHPANVSVDVGYDVIIII